MKAWEKSAKWIRHLWLAMSCNAKKSASLDMTGLDLGTWRASGSRSPLHTHLDFALHSSCSPISLIRSSCAIFSAGSTGLNTWTNLLFMILCGYRLLVFCVSVMLPVAVLGAGGRVTRALSHLLSVEGRAAVARLHCFCLFVVFPPQVSLARRWAGACER